MTYQEQRKAIITACKQAGACEPEFKRLKRTRSEAAFAAVLRKNVGWATHYLPAYLPDGTYGSEGYLLFGVADGKLGGEYRYWYKNGKLWEHAHYQQGRLHGERKRWYSNGTLEEHCHYDQGQRHGEYKRWCEDGTIWIHWHYQHSRLHGECKRWHKDGNLCLHAHYQQGKRVKDYLA